MTFPAKHISVSINTPAAEVNNFLSNPKNWSLWAAGLSESELQKSGNDWFTDSPMGKIRIKFSEPNTYGVFDHDVTLPTGEVNHNPMRVAQNGEGSEVIFTLYKVPRLSDADFNEDAKAVQKDLEKLKTLLEQKL